MYRKTYRSEKTKRESKRRRLVERNPCGENNDQVVYLTSLVIVKVKKIYKKSYQSRKANRRGNKNKEKEKTGEAKLA